jgi:hypothetical protein
MFRIKNSMKFVVSKDREAVAKDLRTIDQVRESTLEEAEGNLQAFVPTLDPRKHLRSRERSISNHLVQIQLEFQRRKETLHDRIIPTVPLSAHAARGLQLV